jgi:hypothetical protein
LVDNDENLGIDDVFRIFWMKAGWYSYYKPIDYFVEIGGEKQELIHVVVLVVVFSAFTSENRVEFSYFRAEKHPALFKERGRM